MKNKESQTVEYKQTWRNDCLKAVSAFANSDGGCLYIGLDDQGNPTSLKNEKKLLEDIPNTIRNKLGIIPPVELNKKNKKDIIKGTVAPCSVPISYNGKYYIRSGSTVQELQGKELADFLMKKSGATWDDIVEERAGLNEIDNDSIENFKKFAVDRIPSIIKETNNTTLLQKLNLIDDKELKRASVLLFGNEPQKFYRQSVIRIGKFLSDTEIQTTDIIKGNLFVQLESALEILRTKYLVSNIKYEGIHRRDILEYPYEALREAIINALIHRDYSGTSQIQIRVYSDKLIIMNEGKLPPEIPVEKLKTNHLSIPRNTLLAKIFYYAGFIESWGHGTIKIIENCIKQGLPEPDFIEEYGVMTVIFYKDKWNEKNLKKLELNERQIKAVMYVKENGKITNNQYQKIFSVSKATATRNLTTLVNKGLLVQYGETGKGTFYKLKGSQTAQRNSI
ncbi:MAG: putative DNA binding domain-containing protein [Bacteroidetes bacterium]|nr:putative DNA binding domain-containing protein [Bacteroidota bacterium]MBL7103146.1 putative DNA binding domain-containing protein [Bacteroidales bacterium]